MSQPFDVRDEALIKAIHELILKCGSDPNSFAADLTTQMIQTSLKLLLDEHDLGQMKLITRAIKEMRYAYRVFHQYPAPCVGIFGSARTPETHPDYQSAVHFSRLMAKAGWMCITGAADGIMRAGMVGAETESSFGLSILLPFETTSNPYIQGDHKLMIFRYFFTRKLMFATHSKAFAAFPGGFGTLDELFEVLTLIQTGKSAIVPIILLEGKNGQYWQHWQTYIEKQLLANGWINEMDQSLYYISSSPADAKRHIMKFYRRYHSSRYVNDLLVIRLLKPLNVKQLAILNDQFSKLVASGTMQIVGALPEETDHLTLPRLIFHHTRRDFGLLRSMIDQINLM